MERSSHQASRVAVLADCHVHQGDGPWWSEAVLSRLDGVDLIVTLGDMGEVAGLDRLAAIAPVVGVQGFDDETDPRTAPVCRTLDVGGAIVGCVFDPVRLGIARTADPFAPADGWLARAHDAFGVRPELILFGSTHRGFSGAFDGIAVVDPGSALLPADGAQPSFALLRIEKGKVSAELVLLAS